MTDDLEWKRRKEGEDNWRARNADDDGTYIVYILNAYGTTQICGVLMSDAGDGYPDRDFYASTVGVGSVAEAKDAAQEHHYAACRAKRWAEYMRDNEPPEESA